MNLPDASSDPASPASILVIVNGEAHTMSPPATAARARWLPTLAMLLAQLGHDAGSVATAVNGEFIARNRRDTSLLQPGDRISCFKPIVGG